jgi:hypothetical protein
MNWTYKAAWVLWICGTILIVGSWASIVPNEVGWVGFVVALGGTLLSFVSHGAPTYSGSLESEFLCDKCNLNHGDVCIRTERPNAKQCPDYVPLGRRW